MGKLAFKLKAASKAVFFLPGYPALDTVIICYLQTPSIIELKKNLESAAERKSLLIHSWTCISFPCFLPIFLPPDGLSYKPSFYLRTTAKPQFPVFYYPGKKVVSASLICDSGP